MCRNGGKVAETHKTGHPANRRPVSCIVSPRRRAATARLNPKTLMENNQQPPLVLASGSRYRRDALRRLGLAFEVRAADICETPLEGESGAQLVERLAKAKADAVAPHYPGALIIGCDECAAAGDALLGKPGDFDCARRQLLDCAGRTVVFHSGVCVLDTRNGNRRFADVPTRVHYRRLNERQIESYLRRDKPYDCAGSFRSESLGALLCERIESEDPSALLGLPVIALAGMLEEAGFKML